MGFTHAEIKTWISTKRTINSSEKKANQNNNKRKDDEQQTKIIFQHPLQRLIRSLINSTQEHLSNVRGLLSV